MNQYDINYPRTADQVVIAQNSLIRQVYAWMGLGLGLTAIVALVTASSPELFKAIVTNRPLFYGLMIGELALVFTLSGAINRLSETTATFLFLGYSILNGVTLSVIFLMYTADSIASTFAADTAALTTNLHARILEAQHRVCHG